MLSLLCPFLIEKMKDNKALIAPPRYYFFLKEFLECVQKRKPIKIDTDDEKYVLFSQSFIYKKEMKTNKFFSIMYELCLQYNEFIHYFDYDFNEDFIDKLIKIHFVIKGEKND